MFLHQVVPSGVKAQGVRRSFANIEFADWLGAVVFGSSVLTRVAYVFVPGSHNFLVELGEGLDARNSSISQSMALISLPQSLVILAM